MKAPHGIKQIRKVFGDIQILAGRVHPPTWEKQNIISITLPGIIPKVRCHRLIAPLLRAVFNEIQAKGLLHLIKSYDGCYNPRLMTGSKTRMSTHSWGISIDINASDNRFGKIGKMDKKIVAIFKKYGFTWGGGWKTPDFMHYQYCSGY